MRLLNLKGDILEFSCLEFQEFTKNNLLPLSLCSTSKGNQKKYKTLDGRYYVKEQFYYQDRYWADNVVEVIASAYARRCQLSSDVKVVEQGLCRIHGREGSYSEAFDRKGVVFVSYNRARKLLLGKEYELSGTPADCFYEVCDDCTRILGKDATNYIVHMMLLDLVVASEDRHLNNFGFLKDPSGNLSFAPLFDFGIGMFEGDTAYDVAKETLELPNIYLKPFWFKISDAVDFLLDECGQYWSETLPKRIQLSDYNFPSELAKRYFKWVNERLGVVVDRG